MHKDHVVTLPVTPFASHPEAELEIIGGTEACAVQGLYTRRKVITVQGHPEFNATIIHHVCQYRQSLGIFTDSMVKDALSRCEPAVENHGASRNGIAAAFLRFAMEP